MSRNKRCKTLCFDFTGLQVVEPILPSELVRYFYLNVAYKSTYRILIDYAEDADIQTYADNNHMVVAACKTKKISENVPEGTILFTQDICKRSKKARRLKIKERLPIALFRHMRNAFAHFRITQEGEYIVMHDEIVRNGRRTLTMS